MGSIRTRIRERLAREAKARGLDAEGLRALFQRPETQQVLRALMAAQGRLLRELEAARVASQQGVIAMPADDLAEQKAQLREITEAKRNRSSDGR
jgi:hypothetical protein